MTFKERRIDVTITLGAGSFGEQIGDTITLTGHRVQAEVSKSVGDAQGQLSMRIFGLPLKLMNQLTAVGPINEVRGQNRILVSAGDEGEALTTVFAGSIDTAYADFQGAPDVSLVVMGLAASVAAVKPVQASSYVGAVDVAQIFGDLAGKMGLAFEPNGVSAMLSNPYLPGTALQQAQSAARAAGVRMVIDDGVLAVFPFDGSRSGDVPKISPKTGLVGYPTYSSHGIGLTTLFNPGIKPGGSIEVDSSVTVACGTWNVVSVSHSLESRRPGGAWFSTIIAGRPTN